jgi:lipopolysaccharide biosynthesis protein/glycosyltransferase involved in cell wall biosynthesis
MSKNIVFVSHCDFTGNSAMHLFSIANALADLGHSCAVCVPIRPETVLEHGHPRFQALDYENTERHGVSFANGRAPDLIHAWTPRELVRKMTLSLTQRYGSPYFVHLEDNEYSVLLDEIPGRTLNELKRLPTPLLDQTVSNIRIHPHRFEAFLTGARGVSALIDRLLEFKPDNLPGMVFFPGHDSEFSAIGPRDEAVRQELGIGPDQLLVVYTGNIHNSNFREIRSLLLAISIVNRRGFPVKLVKTGWNYYPLSELSNTEVAQHVIDLGFVPRRNVARLLAAADVLIQPGQPGEFNDYRFPSKLPEFLASGRPVILPRSNIGLVLKDGEEALVLQDGHSADIADALQRLACDPALRAKLGRNGRAFALDRLNWAENASALPVFYDRCLIAVPEETNRPAGERPVLPKLIAFYLPQFHPIPENDEWWGKGFTEWTNVASAHPNFQGHDQPRLPADLGFYDLRLPETMVAQIALARRYGIYGFCFYYYWFDGRRLLERPLDQFLAIGRPDFPFCICWANENWTRRWDGHEEDVLMKQNYSPEFAQRFIRDAIPILKDPRYIRVNGAPVLMVYRIDRLPDPRAAAEIWREECRKAGIAELHLVTVQSFGVTDPQPYGFDAAVEFPPHTNRFLIDPKCYPGIDSEFDGSLEDFNLVVSDQLDKPLPDYVLYRGVMPSWDNTPRRGRKAHILINSSPEAYQRWLRRVTAETMALAEVQEPIILVNAWNEWAEGAVLEPDNVYGHRFLEATRAGLGEGLADHLSSQGFDIANLAVSDLAIPDEVRMKAINHSRHSVQGAYKTGPLLSNQRLASIADRYRSGFGSPPLSYATVKDFCDSFDNVNAIATLNGDLKDSQRPWVLKAILSTVPRGGRVLEIGAGEPFIADILDRLGYEVWIVDPYDGTGNGPLEYERFRNECPNVRFVRGLFGEGVLSAPAGGFDCIYSISVLEHVPLETLGGLFRGLKKYLKVNGWSIHAVDHVHKGNGATEHYRNLEAMVVWSGHEKMELSALLKQMDEDVETYYLSAESHNRWRGAVPYDQFPMRVCTSIQFASRAAQLRPPTSRTD